MARRRLARRAFDLEPLETRLVLTAPGALDSVGLDAGQVLALRQSIEALAHQLSAVEVSGTLGAATAGIADPLGCLTPIGDRITAGLADPIAPRLSGAMTVAAVRDAFTAAASAGCLAIRDFTARVDGPAATDTLWFELTIGEQRSLPDYELALGQHPGAAGAAATTFDRGLRLGPVTVPVTAGFEGRIGFGIVRSPGVTGIEAIQLRLEPIRVFATATAAADDLEASLGAFRLASAAGTTDVAVDLDVGATLALPAGAVTIPAGRLVAAAAADLFTVAPAAGNRFDVALPFQLALGGFAESGRLTSLHLSAPDPFAGPDSIAIAPLSLTPSDGGTSIDFATFGGTRASDFGAAATAVSQLAPSFLADVAVPVVGKRLDGLFDLGHDAATLVASLSGPGGVPSFDTVDAMLERIAAALPPVGDPARAIDPADLGLRWNAAAGVVEFLLPLASDLETSAAYDVDTLVPESLRGRQDADAGGRFGGLSFVGEATAKIELSTKLAVSVGVRLPPVGAHDDVPGSTPAIDPDADRLSDRISFSARAIGTAALSLDSSIVAGAALGPIALSVKAGQGRVVGAADLTVSLADLGRPDGRTTLADIASAASGIGAAVKASVDASALDGRLELSTTPSAMGALGLAAAAYTTLSAEGAGIAIKLGSLPTPSAVPSLGISSGTGWGGVVVTPSPKLTEIAAGHGEISFADLPTILRLVSDWLASTGIDDVALPLASGTLGDLLGLAAAAKAAAPLDLLPILGDPAVAAGTGSAFQLPSLQNVIWQSPAAQAIALRGSAGLVDLDLNAFFDETLRELHVVVPEAAFAPHAATITAWQKLVWDFGALRRDWQARVAGPNGFGDFDGELVRRLRAWAAAGREILSALPTPASHPDFDWSPAPDKLPHYAPLLTAFTAILDGIDHLGVGFEDFSTRLQAALPGIGISLAPATPDGVAGGGEFEVKLTFDTLHAKLRLPTIDAPGGIPLSIHGGDGLTVVFGGSATVQLGWDPVSGTPTLAPSKAALHLEASVDTGAGAPLTATLGGLSGLTIGSADASSPFWFKLTDTAGAGPATFDLTAAGTVTPNVKLDAGFPLFHPLRPHLGTLAASAVIEPSATPTFTLTPTYHPDLDPQGKAYFASPRAILEAPDLPVDLGAWRSGAEAFIDALTTGLVGDLLAKLPFLGGIDAEDIGFFTTLANLFGDINLDSPDTFRTSLANLAGATAGLRIVSAAGAAHDVIEWSKLAADDAVVVDLTLSKTDVTTLAAGKIKLGVDALGLSLRGQGALDLATDFTLHVGLGYSRVDGFFLEGVAGNELSVGVGLGFGATADGAGSELELGLGSLYFRLTDNTNGRIDWDGAAPDPVKAAAIANRELDAHLGLDIGAGRIGLASLPDLVGTATVAADIRGNLDVKIEAEMFSVSTVSAGLGLGFSEADGSPIHIADLDPKAIDFGSKFHFDGIRDISLGMEGLVGDDSFLSRLFDKFNAITEPLAPIIGILEEEVPVISDLSRKVGRGPVTYLKAIEESGTLGPQGQKFLDLLEKVASVRSILGGIQNGVTINFGDLQAFSTATLLGSTPIGNEAFGLQSAGAIPDLGLGGLEDSFGITFPLLTDPATQVFRLLFGRPVDLIRWDVPGLEAHFSEDDYYQIWGPFVGHLFGGVDIGANLDLIFDTRGIRAAFGGSSVAPLKIFDGLCFDDHLSAGVDAPEAWFRATVGAGLGVGIADFAVAGIDGGLFGSLEANFKDNNGDGKVYLDEFVSNFLRSPECVFDFAGALKASLDAYLKVGFDGPWGWVSLYHKTYNLGSATIADFDAITCPPADPVLAEIVTATDTGRIDGSTLSFGSQAKVLVLNSGPRADRVVPGATTDGDEEFILLPAAGGGMTVRAWGHETTFSAAQMGSIRVVYFDAGVGNDVIEVSDGLDIALCGFGGPGNDRITGGLRANRLWGDAGTVDGNAGNDQLRGRRGDDQFFGGGGDDFLWGYGGADTLNGGDGADVLYGEDEAGDLVDFKKTHLTYGAGAAGNDTIAGGTGADTIHGGDGKDTIRAGEGDDDVSGGRGADTIYGDAGNDAISGDDGNDTIHGDGGNDLDPAVAGDDRIEGGNGVNVLHGGPGDDTIWVNSEALGVFAPAVAGAITAAGETAATGLYGSWASGDDGRDTLYGSQGADFLAGGFESDVIRSGTGADLLLGGPSSDWLAAGGGDASIFGGHGNDVIDGGAGNNWIEGGPGDDDIYGREGADTVYGGTTSLGYAWLLADEASGRLIEDALHGGFTSRLRTGQGNAPCAPEVFYHPEVFPESPYAITVSIFEDLDGDGSRDPGEPDATSGGTWGIVVASRSDATIPAFTLDSPGGTVALPARDGLPAGSWLVSVRRLPSDDWTPSPGTVTSVLLPLDAEHPSAHVDFAFYRPGTISGFVRDVTAQPSPAAGIPVYLDLDGDGSHDAVGDPDLDEPVAFTDATGRYAFSDLLPGAYTVRIAALPFCGHVAPEQRDVMLTSGGSRESYDFTIATNTFPVVKQVLLGEGAAAPIRWSPVPDGAAQTNAIAPAVSFTRIAFEVCSGIGLGKLAAGATLHAVAADGKDGAVIALAYLGTPTQPNRLEYAFVKPLGSSMLPAGRYRIVLDDDSVTSVGGNRLDGEWTNPSPLTPGGDRYASGDGTSGGDFVFEFVIGAPMAPAAAGAQIVQVATGIVQGTVRQLFAGGLGAPLPGQRVELVAANGSVVASATSGDVDLDGDGAITGDERGAFRFTAVAPGQYTIRQIVAGPWIEVSQGGASVPDQLWAFGLDVATGKGMLSAIDPVVPSAAAGLVVDGIAVRDVAMTAREIAYVTGTAVDGQHGVAAGIAGLWRLDTTTGQLAALGVVPGGSVLVALDTLDGDTLLGVRADGGLLRFSISTRVWSDLGALLGADGSTWYPVGDVAVVGPREVYAIALPRMPASLDAVSPGDQVLLRIDPGVRGPNATIVRRLLNDKIGTALIGLEWLAGTALVALGRDESLFKLPLAAAQAVTRLGAVAGLPNLASGGLAVSRATIAPTPGSPDFTVNVTGGGTIDVSFGDQPSAVDLRDGDDFIDGGCGEEKDSLYGDDGTDLPTNVRSIGGHDWLRGRGGDDVLSGGLQGDTFLGNDGADTLLGARDGFNWFEGNAGNDLLKGGADTDIAFGNAGNDTLQGGAGADILCGGAENDTLSGGSGSDTLAGGTGADTLRGDGDDDVLVFIDQSLGGEFDQVPPGPEADTLDGGTGLDTLVFLADASARLTDGVFDVWQPLPGGGRKSWGTHTVASIEKAFLTGGASANELDGGGFSGPLAIVGGAGNDLLTGGTAADWIVGNGDDDTIDGGGGNDTLLGGTGRNTLSGGRNDDTFVVIAGGINRIVELAGGGRDTLDASRINAAQTVRVGSALEGTIVTGAAGTSTSFANDALEAMVLGAGSDSVVIRDASATTARIDAGVGVNTLSYVDPTAAWIPWKTRVVVDLAAGTATATAGISGFTVVRGGAGGDLLSGDAAANTLDGGGGADTLDGRAGDDRLEGGAGNDTLIGGPGNDLLSASAGINALAGGLNDDIYEFADSGAIDTVTEAAGQGTDRMSFTAAGSGFLFAFTVDGRMTATSGTTSVTALTAAGIDRIRGSGRSDRFRLASGVAFAGVLDGGGFPAGGRDAFDTLDYGAWAAPVTVDFGSMVNAASLSQATATGGIIDLRHVIGGTRADRLSGGVLGVWFEGGADADTLTGSTGDDLLDGGNGNDTILGREGNDTLRGGFASDRLVGGKGDDSYEFANLFGTDSVEELPAEGSDRMDFAAVNAALEVRLGSVTVTAAGASATHAGSAIEAVIGGTADDRFLLTGPNVVFPGLLDGGGGSNTLVYQQATVAIDRGVAAGRTPNVGVAVSFARTVVELALPSLVRDSIDLDGNGTADTIWQLANGSFQGWLTDAAGAVVGRRNLGGDASWSIATVGDFNADGVTDLAWRNAVTGTVDLRLMRANGVVASSRPIGGDLFWSIEASGDYDGDGRDDLIWRHTASGANVMWLLDGLAVRSQTAIGGDLSRRLVATGSGYDADGDGRTDLLWRTATGVTTLARMDGSKVLDVTALNADPSWSIVATGDFNGDRRHDIAWRTPAASVTVWLMDGARMLASAVIGGDSRTDIVGTLDRVRDGRTDLAWRDVAGTVTVWEMNGTVVTRRVVLGGDGQTTLLRRPGRRVT